jgi:hypothetical protein
VYGLVPVVTIVEDRLLVCPCSTVLGVAVIVGAISAEFTVTVTALEITTAEAPSVTWSSKFQFPVAVEVVVTKE